jgi:hypothetical protein
MIRLLATEENPSNTGRATYRACSGFRAERAKGRGSAVLLRRRSNKNRTGGRVRSAGITVFAFGAGLAGMAGVVGGTFSHAFRAAGGHRRRQARHRGA